MNALHHIAHRIRNGSRLLKDEALELLKSHEIIDLGILADELNQKVNGDVVWFNEHRYLTLHHNPEPADGIGHLLERTGHLVTQGTTELRMGSAQPEFISADSLLRLVGRIKDQWPDVIVRAFSAGEILRYSSIEGISPEAFLRRCQAAGTDYLDGRTPHLSGGFQQPGRRRTPGKEDWLAIHETAHGIGLASEVALEYGRGESLAGIIGFLDDIRNLQDKTGGFLGFVPLPAQIQETSGGFYRRTIGTEDLKFTAVARIFLDNFKHIKASWGRYGQDIAQLILNFGANSLEGTVSNDNNSRVAGARPFRSMNRREIQSLIEKAPKHPVEHRGHPAGVVHQERAAREDIALLLYKAEQSHNLEPDEAIHLARHATPLQLGHCASIIKHQTMPNKQVGIMSRFMEIPPAVLSGERPVDLAAFADDDHPVVILDLGRPEHRESNTLNRISGILQEIQQERPGIDMIVLGLKALWRLAHYNNTSLLKAVATLKQYGVTSIESSPHETEDDLTTTEIINTHRLIHEGDITSVAKVEVAASYNGTDIPFWKNFIRRIGAMNEIQAETHGILGLKIEPARGSVISPSEYLQAVSLARICAKDIPNIITPFSRIPSLTAGRRTDQGGRRKMVTKFAPICIHFGANDFGLIGQEEEWTEIFRQELIRSGLETIRRSARFYPL